jgi:hypothetical protein
MKNVPVKAAVTAAELRKLAGWLCKHWDRLDEGGNVDGLIEAMEFLNGQIAHAGLAKRLKKYEADVAKWLANHGRQTKGR